MPKNVVAKELNDRDLERISSGKENHPWFRREPATDPTTGQTDFSSGPLVFTGMNNPSLSR
jgi:hypothetical protein